MRRATWLCTLAVLSSACATHRAYPNGLECGNRSPILLVAQAIPSASAVPCLDGLPRGFSTAETIIERDRVSARIRTDDDQNTALLTFKASCLGGAHASTELEVGCVSWTFDAALDQVERQMLIGAVVLVTREAIQADVRDGFIEDTDL